MIFGKTNVPLRLFVDLDGYVTDRGVKAEVYAPGTSSAGSTLITTVTLTHNSGIVGHYEALYSPPDGYDDLLYVRYVTYTNTGYGTRDTTYPPKSEQIVLNSGVGQLGGGSISSFRFDYQLAAKEIKKLLKNVDLGKIEKLLFEIKDGLEKQERKVEALVLGGLGKVDALVKQSSKQIEGAVAKGISMVVDEVSANNQVISQEQSDTLNRFLTEQVLGVLIDIISSVLSQLSSKLSGKLEKVTAISLGKYYDEIAEIKQTVKEFNRQLQAIREQLVNLNFKRLR